MTAEQPTPLNTTQIIEAISQAGYTSVEDLASMLAMSRLLVERGKVEEAIRAINTELLPLNVPGPTSEMSALLLRHQQEIAELEQSQNARRTQLQALYNEKQQELAAIQATVTQNMAGDITALASPAAPAATSGETQQEV